MHRRTITGLVIIGLALLVLKYQQALSEPEIRRKAIQIVLGCICVILLVSGISTCKDEKQVIRCEDECSEKCHEHGFDYCDFRTPYPESRGANPGLIGSAGCNCHKNILAMKDVIKVRWNNNEHNDSVIQISQRCEEIKNKISTAQSSVLRKYK